MDFDRGNSHIQTCKTLNQAVMTAVARHAQRIAGQRIARYRDLERPRRWEEALWSHLQACYEGYRNHEPYNPIAD